MTTSRMDTEVVHWDYWLPHGNLCFTTYVPHATTDHRCPSLLALVFCHRSRTLPSFLFIYVFIWTRSYHNKFLFLLRIIPWELQYNMILTD